MTKLETVEYLLGMTGEKVERVAAKISDERLLSDWNHKDQMDNKGLRLIKVSDEFQTESYIPLRDFTIDAMRFFLNQ